jgi:hypothetical protein
MCDGVVPTDSSFSMSGHQESVGAHVDAHSQHVVFDLVSFCGPFRHRLLRHYEGPIILTHGPKLGPCCFFRELWPARRLTQGQERGRPRPTGWALEPRGESGRIGEGSDLPTDHSRPHALGWERGCEGKGQEFARPTGIRSHGSKVQTPSRQAGPKGFGSPTRPARAHVEDDPSSTGAEFLSRSIPAGDRVSPFEKRVARQAAGGCPRKEKRNDVVN